MTCFIRFSLKKKLKISKKRRGSEAGGLNKRANNGEPVLMDYVKRTDSPKNSMKKIGENNLKNNGDYLINGGVLLSPPRREKTESDIVLRNSDARRSVRESLEARRREVEAQFAKEVDNMKRRNSRPIEINTISLSATNSVDGEEYLYIQVIFGYFFFL